MDGAGTSSRRPRCTRRHPSSSAPLALERAASVMPEAERWRCWAFGLASGTFGWGLTTFGAGWPALGGGPGAFGVEWRALGGGSRGFRLDRGALGGGPGGLGEAWRARGVAWRERGERRGADGGGPGRASVGVRRRFGAWLESTTAAAAPGTPGVARLRVVCRSDRPPAQGLTGNADRAPQRGGSSREATRRVGLMPRREAATKRMVPHRRRGDGSIFGQTFSSAARLQPAVERPSPLSDQERGQAPQALARDAASALCRRASRACPCRLSRSAKRSRPSPSKVQWSSPRA